MNKNYLLNKKLVLLSNKKLFDIKCSKIKSDYIKNISDFEKLDKKQLDSLEKDLIKYPVFRKKFLKNIELVRAYQITSEDPAVRTEIRYLESILNQINIPPSYKAVVILLNNKNKNREGLTYKGVCFKRKKICMDKYFVEGVFPDFSDYCLFSAKLDIDDYLISDILQFKILKDKLKKQFDLDQLKIIDKLKELNEGQEYSFKGKKLSGEKMLEKQIYDINNPKNPKVFGFIWHHNEEKGCIQLVSEKKHNVKHSGGKSIWGGGVHHR